MPWRNGSGPEAATVLGAVALAVLALSAAAIVGAVWPS
ncbi:hypothetical protein Mnod_6249 [Methylobacterium nodulans ORS 2060]|uniref:Uncharacterized protein n=1 Tax=Methylobacterium nodulans (strain LMG 21967 / CNCM I-2342 / ORS 2060) TaxID=460265 RepID=B8IAL0_METNO|nr:hypothetical protein Mnod_6249 [Methylobacterium nodulans ORS 2060]